MAALKDPLGLEIKGTVDKSIYHAPIPYREVLLNPNLGESTQYE